MLPESSTGLYWSIRGTVLCRAHAAELDSAAANDVARCARILVSMPTVCTDGRRVQLLCAF